MKTHIVDSESSQNLDLLDLPGVSNILSDIEKVHWVWEGISTDTTSQIFKFLPQSQIPETYHYRPLPR